MKVALLQFAPEVGKVQDNLRRADEILQETQIPEDTDWLVLPEMAFSGKCYLHVTEPCRCKSIVVVLLIRSGYNFHSLEEIRPYLEPTTAGVTTQWAIRAAQQYNCTVTVGYPEITITEPKKQCEQRCPCTQRYGC
jgi:protein N-terminal amidase